MVEVFRDCPEWIRVLFLLLGNILADEHSQHYIENPLKLSKKTIWIETVQSQEDSKKETIKPELLH